MSLIKANPRLRYIDRCADSLHQGGIFMLKTLRDRGLKAVIFEAGNDTGGTWRWNVSKPRRHANALVTQVLCFVMPLPIPK